MSMESRIVRMTVTIYILLLVVIFALKSGQKKHLRSMFKRMNNQHKWRNYWVSCYTFENSLTKAMEKRLNRNYTRMLQVLNDKSWEDILRTTNLCDMLCLSSSIWQQILPITIGDQRASFFGNPSPWKEKK